MPGALVTTARTFAPGGATPASVLEGTANGSADVSSPVVAALIAPDTAPAPWAPTAQYRRVDARVLINVITGDADRIGHTVTTVPTGRARSRMSRLRWRAQVGSWPMAAASPPAITETALPPSTVRITSGSVQVTMGESVTAGEQIARVGDSEVEGEGLPAQKHAAKAPDAEPRVRHGLEGPNAGQATRCCASSSRSR